jgi:transposase
MPKTRRRNQAREQFWRDTIAAWRQSGQSVRAFCAARGVSEATFFARRRELIDRAPLPQPPAPAPVAQFVPVNVVPDPTAEVALPGRLIVRVPVAADPAAVARLVAAVGGVSHRRPTEHRQRGGRAGFHFTWHFSASSRSIARSSSAASPKTCSAFPVVFRGGTESPPRTRSLGCPGVVPPLTAAPAPAAASRPRSSRGRRTSSPLLPDRPKGSIPA